MKLTKWLIAASALAVAGGAGIVNVNVGTANGVTGPEFTASHGHIACNLAGKGTITPPLANDWTQSDHQSDPNTDPVVSNDMATIPDTQYASMGPTTLAGALKSSHCTGTASDNASHSAPITKATVTTTTSIGDNLHEASCDSFITLFSGPNTLDVTTTIAWTATGAIVDPTTIHSTLKVVSDPITSEPGFELDSTSVTGSFAGGTSTLDSYINTGTLLAFVGAAPDTTTPSASVSVCQPSVSLKVKPPAAGAAEAVSLKLKKPKGFKAITFCPCTAVGDTSPAQSTMTVDHA